MNAFPKARLHRPHDIFSTQEVTPECTVRWLCPSTDSFAYQSVQTTQIRASTNTCQRSSVPVFKLVFWAERSHGSPTPAALISLIRSTSHADWPDLQKAVSAQ